MATTHIVGAGMAGLAAAVKLTTAGRSVVLYEAASHAGGRCRSFHDSTLERVIDNGNHLLLSGNKAVFDFLRTIGSDDSLMGPASPEFHFFDAGTNERWCVRPNLGFFPWWIFAPSRRVPGSRARDYLAALKLAFAGPQTLITEALDPKGALYRKYWEPLAVSVLNTPADEGAACLLWPVVLETFGRGGGACRPMLAKSGLSDSFVDPAITYLQNAGADIRFGARLRAVERTADKSAVTALNFPGGSVPLAQDDQVILALPAPVLGDLLTDVQTPALHYPIVNVHFRLDVAPAPTEPVNFLGVIGGTAEWLFVRGDIISVTISAAKAVAEMDAVEIIERTWGDISKAFELSESPPKRARVVKEKRATFAQTPASLAMRANTDTATQNLKLAGDWTNTGIPATIEGAIRSGNAAAKAILHYI